jgi:hypothetical protein
VLFLLYRFSKTKPSESPDSDGFLYVFLIKAF